LRVKLLAHTQLSDDFRDRFDRYPMGAYVGNNIDDYGATDGQVVALSAIRTCYSANKPSEIVAKEGKRYFETKASDGEGGSEADRLIRQIFASKHTSTLEHLSFTFAIEGVSRALLAQLTRHRVGFSFSVQSQRYVRLGSDDKSGGFDYVVPDKIANEYEEVEGYGLIHDADKQEAGEVFRSFMEKAQETYDDLRRLGIPAEDARAVLPNATATNLVMTANLTALIGFYSKRKPGNGAQAEIANLAEALIDAVIAVEPWTSAFFE